MMEETYIQILIGIKNAVTCDDVGKFYILSVLLNHMNSSKSCETISSCQQKASEKLGNINLICLACKSSSVEILNYLFRTENVIYNLPYTARKNSLVPEAEDEECHNAFYYAIRSNICSLVEILIGKWPNEPFKGNPDRLDQILAEAYKDLLVRNVCINKEMELYIKNKLMDLRLFDDTPAQSNTASKQTDIQHLRNLTALRLDFVIESIVLVRAQIQKSEPEELVLLCLKYIAKNIHMLKSAIMSTTNLHWEEIEFCLAIYIRLSSKRFEKDFLYRSILNKERITIHLEHFLCILTAVKEKIKAASLNKNRKLVIKDNILNEYSSHFLELLDDFIIIRDLYSLKTIKDSIDLAISADASQKEGHLLVTKALQVIGEHLKNTKDSPKLSDATYEPLNSALPSDLKKIVTELRDCLSHAESLCLRSEIEESGESFVLSMQSDIYQIYLVVNEIFWVKKIEVICMTLRKMLSCKDYCSMKSYVEENFISMITFKRELDEASNFSMGIIEILEHVFNDIDRENEKQLNRAKTLYQYIHDISREKDYSLSDASKSMTLVDFTKKMTEMLKEPKIVLQFQGFMCEKIDKFLEDELRLKKIEATKSAVFNLKTFLGSPEIEFFFRSLNKLDETIKINRENVEECKKIISHWEEFIDRSARSRKEKIQNILSAIQSEKDSIKTFLNGYKEALKKFVNIFNGTEVYVDVLSKILKTLTSFPKTDIFFKETLSLFEDFHKQFSEALPKAEGYSNAVMNSVRLVELRMGKFEQLKEFQIILKSHKKSRFRKSPEQRSKFKASLKDQLSMKITTLRNLLKDYHLKDVSSENVELDLKDPKLRSVIEILMLDVSECLSERFTHNAYFLDDDYPIVNGKNFRNHLAHGNALNEILFGDDFTNVQLNACKMVREDLLESDRKIGKRIKNDPKKSNESHLKDLEAVKQQLELFAALSAGRMEEVEGCIRKGADMKGRNLHLWTTLHFAAKGPNPELVKITIQFYPDINVADVDRQTALHIASAHGRLETVEYLVDTMKMDTNSVDINERTALHVASQKGHANVVEFLLKHVTETTCRDTYGCTPLHYAVEENHVDIVSILLEKEPNQKEIRTSLNLAAMKGHFNIVPTLLEMKEPADLKPDEHFTTLLYATIGGNAEFVNLLIEKGVDVNFRGKNGLTALHLATRHGHKEITVMLLNHGADVNAVFSEVWTPLSFAAKNGNLEILKLLLENGANCDNTPLTLAASFGHYEITKTLLGGCDLSIKMKSLFKAAYKGHKRIVELIMKDVVDVNDTSSFNRKDFALYYAASAGHTDIVNFLIANGCDINALTEFEDENYVCTSPIRYLVSASECKYSDVRALSKNIMESKSIPGQTALHIACRSGYREVVRCLISNKARTTIKDDAGFTPLQLMIFAKMTDIIIEEKVPVNVCDGDEFSPLRLGVVENDHEFVNYCIRQGCGINIGGIVSGCTPLHAAVIMGYTNMVEYLLDIGADINARTKFNASPLDLAVIGNKKEVFNALIKRNLTISDERAQCLFHKAVYEGYDDIVEYFLIRNPGYALAKSKLNNEYPIVNAVLKCHLNILKLILEAGGDRCINDSNKYGFTPLVLAVELGYTEIIQLLLSKGADPNFKTFGTYSLFDFKDGTIEKKYIQTNSEANIFPPFFNLTYSAFDYAVKFKNLHILETLLESSKCPLNLGGQEGRELLLQAIVTGHLQAVKYLNDRGAGIDTFDCDKSAPLFCAALLGHQQIVEYFLSLELNIHDRIEQRNLVHWAAAFNLPDVCELLYKKGVDFNTFDAKGHTPLGRAIQRGNSDVFFALLHFGACYTSCYRSDMITSDYATLDKFLMLVSLTLISHLFSAVCNNDVPKTEVLLSTALTISKFGFANVRISDVGNSENFSLLSYAAWKGLGDIVDLLLKYKAKPNPDYLVNPEDSAKKEKSPLHYASKFSHSRIVKSLLRHGAVFNAVCDSGKTPLDFATDPEISAILQDLEIMFRKIQNGEAIFQILADMKNLDTRRVLMGARNKNGATLLDVAVARDHPEAELLKTLFKADVPSSSFDHGSKFRGPSENSVGVARKMDVNKNKASFLTDVFQSSADILCRTFYTIIILYCVRLLCFLAIRMIKLLQK